MGARSGIRRPAHGQSGAAAVEFALVSVLLFTILLGIIQYALLFWALQVGANAAREGARRYAVAPCDSGANDAHVRSVVQDSFASSVATLDTISVSATFDPGAYPPLAGDDVTVRVAFPTIDIAAGFLPVPSTMVKSATARVEDVEDC